jgi:hypothetical protein
MWKEIQVLEPVVGHPLLVYLETFCIYALYSSPNIIRVIKSRRLRWAGHVTRMGERRGAYRDLVRKPERRRPLGRTQA